MQKTQNKQKPNQQALVHPLRTVHMCTCWWSRTTVVYDTA